MGKHTTHAGRAPCRHCGEAAARAPMQRLAQPRAFADEEAAEVHPGVLRPAGGGMPLPDPVQAKMEAAFGHDFADVRVHHGDEAESIGAVAYTRGAHLHFARGRWQPHTEQGQKLLAHELAHVVQQRAGRVAHPGGAVPINADPALEREAERAGDRAVRGAPAAPPPAAANASGAAA
jgi:hypothetical protein